MKLRHHLAVYTLPVALIAGLTGLGALCAEAQGTVYVSPSGSDKNVGTAAKPVQTLTRARDLVRSLNRNGSGDITVHLAGGTYRLTQPLALGPEDGGSPGHRVLYVADPDQPVIVSGGVRVTGWKRIDAARNLWAAPAPAGLRNTRQLYVNGVRAQRTQGRLPVRLTETPTGYTADSALLSHWRNPGDIEFVYTGGNALWGTPSVGLGGWTEPRCPVASISGATITMAQPCWDNSTKRVMLPASSGFKRTANLVGPASVGKEPASIENAYELLGPAGMWYFDRPARTIYYVPRPGEDLTSADVEAPVLEKLIVAEGTAAQPVSNITFQGLQFSYATWLGPSGPDGLSEIQANYQVTGPNGYAVQGLGKLAPGGTEPYGNWTQSPGNLSFRYDHAISFVEDAFAHLGAAGLQLGDGSQGALVQGCVFTDVSGNGLELGGVDLPEATGADVTADNKIVDNHFFNIAAEYHGGVGIDVGYAQRTLIAHNQLDHLPYTGISIGWGGWPDKINQPGLANTSQNNVIADNLIFDHLLLLADGGGIYTQGLTGPSLADGEKVTGNVVRDQFSSGHAIYSDNGSANMTITGNVMFHTNFDNWGTAHKDFYDGNNGSVRDPFLIADNYWQQGNPDSVKDNVTLRGNHIITAMTQVPSTILQTAGLEPPYRNLLQKRFGGPGTPEPPRRLSAWAGDGLAYVTWTPSIFEGGGPVRSYTVTSSTGKSATISADDYRARGYADVPGLANGRACTFTVTATNDTGTSIPSLPSRLVTPAATAVRPPGAPQNVRVYAGNGAASIHFQAPTDDGGSPITAYTFTANPGGRKVTLTGRIVLTLGGTHTIFGVVDGLQNGQAYTFDVAAVNAAGPGAVTKTKAVTPSPGKAGEQE